MGMSAGSSGSGAHGAPKADINTTPLVDVMLVLLIIFMITAPLMADKVAVELPEAPSEEEGDEAGTQRVTLSIVDKNGIPQYYWNDQIITTETMAARMKSEALRTQNKIRLKVRADRTLKYDTVSKVLIMAKENGVQNVSFISAPAPKG